MASSFLRKVKADCRKQDRIDVFFENIYAGFYDTAWRMVQHDPELAVTRYVIEETALHALARNSSAYASRSIGFLRKVVNFFIEWKFIENSNSISNQALELLQFVWKEIIRRQDINVADFIRKPSDLLFDAAELGDFELLALLLHSYPGLVGELDESLRTIFHVAVLRRRVKILGLIDEIGLNKDLLAIADNGKNNIGNNILHLAAKYQRVSSDMFGAELEMQQEFLIFKEVEMMMPPSLREMKNAEGLTPNELFSIEHNHLLQSTRQHMRTIARSLLCFVFFIPMTLLALFVFPANINKTMPLHAKETLLQLFTISDTMAFFSSCICVLMCLWIIISSHKENDLLMSSPLKYMVAIGAVNTTLISMMVTSNTISYIRLYGSSSWVLWFCLLPVSVLVASSGWIVFPLQRDLFYATYRGWYRSKRCKR